MTNGATNWYSVPGIVLQCDSTSLPGCWIFSHRGVHWYRFGMGLEYCVQGSLVWVNYDEEGLLRTITLTYPG